MTENATSNGVKIEAGKHFHPSYNKLMNFINNCTLININLIYLY